MANNQLSDAFDFELPDPSAIQAQDDAQYNAAMDAPHANVASRAAAGMQQGFNTLRGGSPTYLRAKQLQDAFGGILKETEASAPENEDPLDKQIRIATAASTGLAGIDPRAAMSANDALVKLQQAKAQQGLLAARTEEEKNKAFLGTQQAKIAALSGKSLNVAGVNDKGELQTFGTVDVSDPDAAMKIAKLKKLAADNGVSAGIMSDDSLLQGKQAIALTRANAQMQVAQTNAAARLQAAQTAAAAKGQALNGAQAQQTFRIFSAAEMAQADLHNITNMNIGASSGFLGVGAAPGKGLMQAGIDSLRNEVSSEETQRYNTASAGLVKNISQIEMQGGLQGGQQLADQLRSIIELRKGDTHLELLTKLAQARQIIETGVGVRLQDARLDPQMKEHVKNSVEQLVKDIPYTVDDITQYIKATSKDKNLTMQQYAQTRGFSADNKGGDISTVPVKMYKGGKTFYIPADKVEDAKTHGYSDTK